MILDWVSRYSHGQRFEKPGAILLALCSSGLLVLASPGIDLSFLAWVALVPLLLALRHQSLFSSFWLAFTAGVCANAGIVYWVAIPTEVKAIDFLLIAGYLGMYWALFGVALTALGKLSRLPLVVTAPVLWISLEYLRSNFFFLELPWVLLAHTQYTHTPLIQIASITGVYGISCLIMMVNSTITEVLGGARHAPISALVTLLALGLAVAFGHGQLAVPSEARSLSVTIVPGHIPQGLRWDPALLESNLRHYLTVTKRALETTESSLVVWPETSVPGALRRNLSTLKALQDLTRETKTALLIGSADREKFAPVGSLRAHRFNSAFLFSQAGQKTQTYHKVKLLPFGEYLPLKDSFPWPSRYRTQASHFVAGTEYATFSLSEGGDPTRFSVVICWESIFPNLVRQFVQRGAMFIVAMSNEAWFSGTTATSQLLAMNVFRAVENRRAVVRSVNGGISGFIDPYGRLNATISPEESNRSSEGFLTHAIPLVRSQTLYTLYGDVFAQSVVAAALVFLVVPLIASLWIWSPKSTDASHVGDLYVQEDARSGEPEAVRMVRRPGSPARG